MISTLFLFIFYHWDNLDQNIRVYKFFVRYFHRIDNVVYSANNTFRIHYHNSSENNKAKAWVCRSTVKYLEQRKEQTEKSVVKFV